MHACAYVVQCTYLCWQNNCNVSTEKIVIILPTSDLHKCPKIGISLSRLSVSTNFYHNVYIELQLSLYTSVRFGNVMLNTDHPFSFGVCSAGVGRTGTFIALDCILDQINEENAVDIREVLKRMREKRMWMVQTVVSITSCYPSPHPHNEIFTYMLYINDRTSTLSCTMLSESSCCVETPV